MSSASLPWFVARRAAAMVLLLTILSFVVFSLLYIAPGSPEQALLGARQSSEAVIESLRHQFHLDKPFLEQYWIWLRGAAQFDFGESVRTHQSVLTSIGARAGMTAFLIVYSFVVSVGLGVPLGVLAAMRKRRAADRGVVALSLVGVSTPIFVSGVFLLYLLAVTLHAFPVFGPGGGFGDRLWHLTLPALALALATMALIVKITRTAMIGALGQDYVAFARARGVPEGRVVIRHALRNALVPIVTASGLTLTGIMTGTILVESTFALPGLGSLLLEAVQNKDLPMIQGIAVLLGALVIVINLVVDVVYAAIDPRIRFGAVSR